jgi:hypothetical protein
MKADLVLIVPGNNFLRRQCGGKQSQQHQDYFLSGDFLIPARRV